MGTNVNHQTGTFERCDFLLGEGGSIVIVIPSRLPEADNYTVAATEDRLKFLAGYEDIAEMPYPGGEIYNRIASHTQVGLVEYQPEKEPFPDCITNVAYVEVRRAM